MVGTKIHSAPSVSRGGKRVNAYEVVTERICGLLEKGTAPWRRRWRGGERIPQNLVSHRPYRGMNPFVLECMGYDSPFWLSFKQAKGLGGSVKKGEKGSPVVFWKWFTPKNADPKDPSYLGCRRDRQGRPMLPLLRYFNVFNVAQCEGVDVPAIEAPERNHTPVEAAERLVDGYSQPQSLTHGIGQA